MMLANPKPVDRITLLYIVINLIYIGIGWNRIPNPSGPFLTFSLLLLATILIINLATRFKNPFTEFIQAVYPLVYFGFFFELATQINLAVFPNYLDGLFQSIDFHIFGYQPSLEWSNMLPGWFFQELFHFSYFCYYLMIAGIPLLFYLKKRNYFPKAIFIISLTFYFCFLIYAFLPVIGARSFDGIMELTRTYAYGPFSHIMAFIYKGTNHLGGAFPSSHVAVAVIITQIALHSFPKIGRILIVITVFLTLSTVYCHYHYFIDSITGFALGLLIYKPVQSLYEKLYTPDISIELDKPSDRA